MLKSDENFVRIYSKYVYYVLNKARLEPRLSVPRLIEARGAWKNDLDRVGTHEPKLLDGLDHFKHAAHLAFWLRRIAPLVEAVDVTQNISDAQGYPLSEAENSFRAILHPYAAEYLAFDFGYQIVKFYENGHCPISKKPNKVDVDNYYYNICHFMKYKNVSPHAMYLIYSSLYF